MNKKIILLGVVFIFAYFSACEDEIKKTPPELGNLEVSVENLNFVAIDADKTFSVTSDTKWTVKAINNGNWLTCTPASGEGNQTVSVSVADNSTPYLREAIITVKTHDGVVRNVQVKQIGTEAAILVAPETVTANRNGDEAEFAVTASEAWEVSIPEAAESWITQTVAGDKATLSFSINESGKDRAAEIIFRLKSRDKQAKVVVSQEYVKLEDVEYPAEAILSQDQQAITITGKNLRLVEEVWFGTLQGTIANGRTDESLVVSIPGEATPSEVDLKIVYSGITMIAGKITLVFPVLEVVAPAEGEADQVITLTGTNLKYIDQVFFGETEGTIESGRTDALIKVLIPLTATLGEVDLKVIFINTERIIGKIVLKLPVPEVTAPADGIIGLDITLTGTKLKYIDQVFFGAQEGEIDPASTDVSMKVLIPETTAEGEVNLKIVYFGIDLIVGKITLALPPQDPQVDNAPAEAFLGRSITFTGKSLLKVDKVLFGETEGVIGAGRTDVSMSVTIPTTATSGEVDLIIVFGEERVTVGKITLSAAAFDPDKNLALYAGTSLPNVPKVTTGNANSCGANGRQSQFAFDGVVNDATNAALSTEMATIYDAICPSRGTAHTHWQVTSGARAGSPDLATNPGQIWVKLDYSETEEGVVVFDKIGLIPREAYVSGAPLVTGYTIEISQDNVNWTKVVDTNVPFPNSTSQIVEHILDQPVEAKYVRWVCMTTQFSPEGGAPVTGGSNNTGLRNFYMYRTK